MMTSGWRAGGWLILLALALPGMVCSEPTASPGGTVEVELEVTDSEGQAVRSFSSGEPVHLRLALTNRGDAAVSLPFSSTKTHDAIVLRADGSEVWRWSAGRMFPQVLSELALQPGASEAFVASCDPRRQGQPVLPPGSYEVVGVIPALGSELRSAPVSFEVE